MATSDFVSRLLPHDKGTIAGFRPNGRFRTGHQAVQRTPPSRLLKGRECWPRSWTCGLDVDDAMVAMVVHELTLKSAIRKGDAALRTPTVEFLDYFIDDQSLFEWMKWCSADPDTWTPLRGRYVTPFARGFSFSYRTSAHKRLLLRQEPDGLDGRVSIYVCPLCGDLECGAIYVTIHARSNIIEWSEITIPGHGVAQLPSFAFERAAYTTALTSALAFGA